MNTALVTTGLIPLTIGSVEEIILQPYLNEVPWDLTGGSAYLYLADPTGAVTQYPATIIPNGNASFTWLVSGLSGTWVRAWKAIDAAGIIQVSRPIVFGVESSPV